MTLEKLINSLTELGYLYFWLFCVPVILPMSLYLIARRLRIVYGEAPDVPFGLLGLTAVLLLPIAVGGYCGRLLDAYFLTEGFDISLLLVGLFGGVAGSAWILGRTRGHFGE